MIQNYLKKLGVMALVLSGTTMAASKAQAQATPCSDLFISEYIEGGSFNKSIEIYNPTSAPINLSTYKLTMHNSGAAAASQSLTLSGTVLPGDVFVLSHASANPVILAQTDVQNSTIINFNGDDAVFLWKTVGGTDVIIDKVGDNNGAPTGGAWTVGTGSTKDFTLVRKATVTGGQTNWTVGATEWDVFQKDTDNKIGSHTANCGSTPTVLTVGFKTATGSVAENVTGGTKTVAVKIANPSATAASSVDVALGTTGTATAGTDFTFTGSTLTWAAGDTVSKTVTVTIIDDAVVDPAETVVLTLSNPSTGVTLGTSTFTLTIIDNEIAPIPTFTVAQATTNNTTTLLPTNLGTKVKINGTLYGENQRFTASGLQLTLIDNTGGIGIFTSDNTVVPATVPVEGDSARVIGSIGHFNGLTQIVIDSIVVLANNRTLIQPAIVSGPLNESHESELITLANPVSLVDPNQWNNGGTGSFNVDVTDGTNTYQMRVINNSDIFPTPAPTGTFILTGIGGQFDLTDPRDEGYQIIPRRLSDIRLVTGVSENLTKNISIYPNPVATVLHLNLSAVNTKNASISVINALGQTVANVPANATELNVAKFPAGVYTLRVATPQGVAVKRFVKIN